MAPIHSRYFYPQSDLEELHGEKDQWWSLLVPRFFKSSMWQWCHDVPWCSMCILVDCFTSLLRLQCTNEPLLVECRLFMSGEDLSEGATPCVFELHWIHHGWILVAVQPGNLVTSNLSSRWHARLVVSHYPAFTPCIIRVWRLQMAVFHWPQSPQMSKASTAMSGKTLVNKKEGPNMARTHFVVGMRLLPLFFTAVLLSQVPFLRNKVVLSHCWELNASASRDWMLGQAAIQIIPSFFLCFIIIHYVERSWGHRAGVIFHGGLRGLQFFHIRYGPTESIARHPSRTRRDRLWSEWSWALCTPCVCVCVCACHMIWHGLSSAWTAWNIAHVHLDIRNWNWKIW